MIPYSFFISKKRKRFFRVFFLVINGNSEPGSQGKHTPHSLIRKELIGVIDFLFHCMQFHVYYYAKNSVLLIIQVDRFKGFVYEMDLSPKKKHYIHYIHTKWKIILQASSRHSSKRDRSSFRYQKPNKARNSHHSKKAKNKDSKNKNISVLRISRNLKKEKNGRMEV